MGTIEEVILLAKEEVGYLEKATNSDLYSKTGNAGYNNFTKYAKELDIIEFYNGKKNGYPWCDVFFDWLLYKVFGMDKALEITGQVKGGLGAGTTYSKRYYENINSFYLTPKIGDQIFFSKDKGTTCYHTGLVIGFDEERVYTIEGNTSTDSGVVANGGGVFEKSYARGISTICGYGRPLYPAEIKDIMIKTTQKLEINGTVKGLTAVNLNGNNCYKIRDLVDFLNDEYGYGLEVDYDEKTQITSVSG